MIIRNTYFYIFLILLSVFTNVNRITENFWIRDYSGLTLKSRDLIKIPRIGAKEFLPANFTNDSIQPNIKTDSNIQDFQVFLPSIYSPCNNCFYVDSKNGSDLALGTISDRPWKTLTRLNNQFLPAGSKVYLKRDSSWTGSIEVNESGESGNPITFMSYGDGNTPLIINPGSESNPKAGVILRGSWIVLEGLHIKNTINGVEISSGSQHNIVQNLEIDNTGIGILISGENNLVTNNYIHDLTMIRNTINIKDDDYGAIGISFQNGSYNEVSFNRIERCKAPSYDYGSDGGAVEWWGYSDGNYVHHNIAINNNGFSEIGGGAVRDTIFAYNIGINNNGFMFMNNAGTYKSDINNFRIENNTLVETSIPDPNISSIFLGFKDCGTNSISVFSSNNILYVYNFWVISNCGNYTHTHNIYALTGKTVLGFSLGYQEFLSDPGFVDLNNHNLHLISSSQARNKGLNLGYKFDFDLQGVPINKPPDLGSYQFVGN